MIMVTLIRLGLLALLITLIWQARPQRLDVTLGQAQTIYQSSAGSFRVTVTVIPYGNDNGVADLEIRSNDQLVGVVPSHYNYDFFANQPAGWQRRTWVDGDWQRDLLLVTADAAGYAYVSSQDGRLYWSNAAE